MAVNPYARRYSQAIFRIALENKEINRWQSDLRNRLPIREVFINQCLKHVQLRPFFKKEQMAARPAGVGPMVARIRISKIGDRNRNFRHTLQDRGPQRFQFPVLIAHPRLTTREDAPTKKIDVPVGFAGSSIVPIQPCPKPSRPKRAAHISIPADIEMADTPLLIDLDIADAI